MQSVYKESTVQKAKAKQQKKVIHGKKWDFSLGSLQLFW